MPYSITIRDLDCYYGLNKIYKINVDNFGKRYLSKNLSFLGKFESLLCRLNKRREEGSNRSLVIIKRFAFN